MLTSGMMLQVCIGAMLLTSPPNVYKTDKSTKESKSDGNLTTLWRESKLLLRNWRFILHCISAALHLFCAGTMYTHVVAYVESEGLSSSFSNTVVTAIAAGVLGNIFSSPLMIFQTL